MVRFGAAMLRHGLRSRTTVADLIERRAAATPGGCFVRFEKRSLTYGVYNECANQVAHWALGQGIAKGDVVALLMENRPEFLIVWAGLAKTGATIALLNTNLTGRALSHILETSGADRLVVGLECWTSFATVEPGLRERIETFALRDPALNETDAEPGAKARDLDEELASQPRSNPPRSVRHGLCAGDSLFYIYTSGTTGLPKAARFSHSRFFGACVHSFLKGFGPGDTMYCTLPLYHTVGGVLAVSAVLTGGGTLALRRRFSARAFWADAIEMRATAFVYIGELCRYLVHQPPSDLDRAHSIRFAVGNGLRPDVWSEFQERFAIPHIVEFYGATEANVTMMNLDDRKGSVGRLLPGMKSGARLIRYDVERDRPVRDERGHCVACAPGEVGELIGKIANGRTARGRFEGYTSKSASEEKILRDVFAKGDAWFRSGDLLRSDEQGYFYFVDRIGDTFRWKGENVSTQEVAESLAGFHGVGLCTVYSVEVPGCEGRAGMAAIAPKDGADLEMGGLYRHLNQTLPSYAVPLFVRICKDLDTTGTLKIRKVDLQRQGFDTAVIDDPLYVRDDTRQSYVPLTVPLRRDLESGMAAL